MLRAQGRHGWGVPFFYRIDSTTVAGQRTAARLLELSAFLDAQLPRRTISETLLLATWNIREFDSNKYGHRTAESLSYIAEILSRFDVIAVQEVRSDLAALMKVLDRLGPWWKCVFSDVTEGSRGNQERMAFIYDSRKLVFGGLAGEIVLPPLPVTIVDENGERTRVYQPVQQLARTPHMVGFQAGWFKFSLCTVHMVYGDDAPDTPQRVAEIRALARFLAERSESGDMWSRNLILLGDFNIFSPRNQTFRELIDAGFTVPKALQCLPSNVSKTGRHYDQIAFKCSREMGPTADDRCGVLDLFQVLYRDEAEATYAATMGPAYLKTSRGAVRDEAQRRRHYHAWRTFQISDHLPMWVELQIDFGAEYLRRRAGLTAT